MVAAATQATAQAAHGLAEAAGRTVGAASGAPALALEDICLDIADGDRFGIIGMSGAGKSTLVRTINLLERPTSGKVVVDGRDVTELSDAAPRADATRVLLGKVDWDA